MEYDLVFKYMQKSDTFRLTEYTDKGLEFLKITKYVHRNETFDSFTNDWATHVIISDHFDNLCKEFNITMDITKEE